MGSLVKGVFFGMLGVIALLPVAIVLAILGLPILIAGGLVLAIPLLVIAALSLPFIILAGVLGLVVFVMIMVALKIALFVVLPIAIVIMMIRWLTRTLAARHDHITV